MLLNLLYEVKSNCSVLLWPDAQPLPECSRRKKYKATPRTLRSHSLPRLHAPSSLAPVPGLRPRLHAMLREVLVLIQLTPPPPPLPLFPLLFFPLSLNNNLGFEFTETHTARKCDCTARTALSLFSNSLLQPEWLPPPPQFFPLAEFLPLPHI